MKDLARELAEMSLEPEDPNNRRTAMPTGNERPAWKKAKSPPPPPPSRAARETTTAAKSSGPTMEDLAEAWARMTHEQSDPNNGAPTLPNSMDDLAEAWARMTLEQVAAKKETDETTTTTNHKSTSDVHHPRMVNGSTLLDESTPFFAEAVAKGPRGRNYWVDETTMERLQREELVEEVTDTILANLKSIIERQARIAVERNVRSLEELAAAWVARNKDKPDTKLRAMYKAGVMNGARHVGGMAASFEPFMDSRSFYPDPKI